MVSGERAIYILTKLKLSFQEDRKAQEAQALAAQGGLEKTEACPLVALARPRKTYPIPEEAVNESHKEDQFV